MAVITTALLSLVLAAPQEEVKTKTYRDRSVDLIFDYPESWSLDRQRFANVLQFGIGNEQVLVRLLKTDQRYPAEHWQSSVKMVEETNGNEVLRQWEEELLGVPLLMTRYREQKGAVRSIVLVGLLYSKTPEKVTFRVIAPESVAAQAEREWREVLRTVRTVSGNLPEPEVPGSADPEEVNPPTRPSNNVVKVMSPEEEVEKELFKGPIRVTANAERGIFAYLPEGWAMADGMIVHGETRAALKLKAGVGDLQSAKSAWIKQGAQGMSAFSKIEKRIEPVPKKNKAGFMVMPMIRSGVKDDVASVQHITLGWTAGLSWTTEYFGTAEEWKQVESTVQDLLDRLGVASS